MRTDGIIIDFDYTLFDASAFKNALAASISALGVSNEAFRQTYSEIRKQSKEFGYSPGLHLDALSSTVKFDRETAETGWDKIIQDSRKYLYPDAVLFLEGLSSLNPLLLLSYGAPDFQKRKVAACGIQKYFAEIELTEKDKNYRLKALTVKYGDKMLFINDNIKEIENAVREFPNLKPVLKRRGDRPDQDYLKEAIPNFNTLKEIKEFILTQYEK